MKWSRIKGLFIETEEDEEAPKAKDTPPEDPKKSAPVPSAIPVDISAGKPDQSIIDNLALALEKSNLDGFDYFEFAKVIDQMSTTIPAEQVRYQAAFASAAAMGANKQKLIETADHYVDVLKEEADKFSTMVAVQTKETVTAKEESVKDIDAAIKEKADMITQLTNEINELTSNKTAILNEASENRIKIQKIQNDFAACLKVFLDKITGDKAKIEQYIQG